MDTDAQKMDITAFRSQYPFVYDEQQLDSYLYCYENLN